MGLSWSTAPHRYINTTGCSAAPDSIQFRIAGSVMSSLTDPSNASCDRWKAWIMKNGSMNCHQPTDREIHGSNGKSSPELRPLKKHPALKEANFVLGAVSFLMMVAYRHILYRKVVHDISQRKCGKIIAVNQRSHCQQSTSAKQWILWWKQNKNIAHASAFH